MRYNLSRIMRSAWAIFRRYAVSFSEALHRAWAAIKAEPINRARIEAAKAEAGVSEAVNTWSGWRAAGREVVHGSKAIFQTTLIYASKGDGATYRGSFFCESQTQPINA